MTLKLDDQGEPVKVLQRGLNRLGSLLKVDGDFGRSTETAVIESRAVLDVPGPPEADDALVAMLTALPDPCPNVTPPGVTFIGREEVSSPDLYRQRYRRPTWPGKLSGITIGIGYDLKFTTTQSELHADWGAFVPAETLVRLTPVLGATGSSALLATVADLDFPLPGAVNVFLKRSLPKHIRATLSAYPMLNDLEAPRRTALISLVFNRGSSLVDEPGDSLHRRSEMALIRTLLATGRADDVADQIESMARLWDPAAERGLIDRRKREATLWRSGFAALQLD
jgi:peptidoglycan hydrolase-like protein with peptidoglycan-binding domain